MNKNHELNQQLYEAAQDIAYAANAREPSEECWGMESYGGSSLSGYCGVFFWFSSKEEMLDFTVRHLPFLGEEIGADDPFEGAKQAETVLHAVKTSALSWDEGRIGISMY